ncbi:MAG: class I adenylate-forming enzyme family protein [SAR324 cluster bacterium]
MTDSLDSPARIAQARMAQASVRRGAASTVASLFSMQARLHPRHTALQQGTRRISYAELDERTRRLAAVLAERGVGRGARVAVLAENRLEYLEIFLAAARLGAIVACQNWRLAAPELEHCIRLVEPAVALVSPRHRDKLGALAILVEPVIVLGEPYEALLGAAGPAAPEAEVDPEDPLLILYTSGTTGLPKGAVISHRAELARNLVLRAEFGLAPDDAFVAWSPLYHMGAAEFSLGTLLTGGTVIVVDGFDRAELARIVATERLGWLLLMPGMVGDFSAELRERRIRPAGVKVCGVMADLVPPAELAEVTALLGAPYANTFGSTETGCPPCSSNLIPVGVAPARLSKRQSPFCEVRLVNGNDEEVPDGTPGELCMRGATLFSGYWRADETNARDFRGGWFHMGDVFVRNPDGSLDFVDRVKYMIKSGGESVYPAEIERVLMRDARVAEAAVVRCPHPKWGEVPVAFVARRDASLTGEELQGLCRANLAGFKQPKAIHFIALDEFPRSASGKIQRHVLEGRLAPR